MFGREKRRAARQPLASRRLRGCPPLNRTKRLDLADLLTARPLLGSFFSLQFFLSFPFGYEPSPLARCPFIAFYRVHTDIAINARPPNNEFVFRFIRFSSCLRREIDSSCVLRSCAICISQGLGRRNKATDRFCESLATIQKQLLESFG